jgi:hypothetical protein
MNERVSLKVLRAPSLLAAQKIHFSVMQPQQDEKLNPAASRDRMA